MPSVAWFSPPGQVQTRPPAILPPVIPSAAHRNYRYGLKIEGDTPPWRPETVFDDGWNVYVVLARGIVQGEIPSLFVLGADGSAELVNTRVHRNVLIVDRLFAAADLRLAGDEQQKVRIVRTDGRSRP